MMAGVMGMGRQFCHRMSEFLLGFYHIFIICLNMNPGGPMNGKQKQLTSLI